MTSICVGCGMCCDGTMYKSVDVDDDQISILKDAGLVLTNEESFTFFRQPCTAFSDGCCTIYQARPSVCRWYRCLLLRRFEAGEVALDDAQALIARTTAMRDRVRSELAAYLEDAGSLPLGELYRRMIAKIDAEPDPTAARREHSELLFAVVALRVVLAREFEPRDAKSHVPAD